MFWSVECSLLKAEGLSCPLWKPKDKYNAILDQKNLNFFYIWKILQILVTKTLDPDPHWPKMLDPDPHWNQCGSTTLSITDQGFRAGGFYWSLNILFRGFRRHIVYDNSFQNNKLNFNSKVCPKKLILDPDPDPDWIRIQQEPEFISRFRKMPESGHKAVKKTTYSMYCTVGGYNFILFLN